MWPEYMYFWNYLIYPHASPSIFLRSSSPLITIQKYLKSKYLAIMTKKFNLIFMLCPSQNVQYILQQLTRLSLISLLRMVSEQPYSEYNRFFLLWHQKITRLYVFS